jgi:hypothetical protein
MTRRTRQTKRTKRTLGVIDYTLAKRALLRRARAGMLSTFEICDAHPELMRAAKNVGEPCSRMCPVCDRTELRLLAYVYADELRAQSGRIWALDTALLMTAKYRNAACYVVEVCTSCQWNHLSEAFMARSAG